MYLFIKDFIVALFAPTSLIGLIFITAIVLFKIGRKRISKVLAVIGGCLLVLFATNPFTELLLHLHEGQYPGIKFERLSEEERTKIKYIVVLAGGIAQSDNQPITSQLTATTLTRVVEGVRLWQALPNTQLILSGRGWEEATEATLMAQMAIELGVPENKIIKEDRSLNTAAHPIEIKPIVGHSKFILVTSALHMPRAMMIFKRQGLHPYAAPTGHILTGNYHPLNPKPLYLRGDNLAAMDALFYEWTGMVWGKLKGDL